MINLRERKARIIEYRAQQRASGKIITGPERPVISSRYAEPKDRNNSARLVEFHARYHGEKEPRIQLWA